MRNVFKDVVMALRQYTSPVFLVLLLLSFVLWYVTKLSYNYTTEIPIEVNIGPSSFRVQCALEGTGYRLFAHKYFFDRGVNIPLKELHTTPSMINKGYYVINPFSLQNAISLQNGDVRVVSIGELPEITLDGRLKQ